MCYNGCRYHKVNIMTGDDRCVRPKGADCLEEEEDDIMLCPDCALHPDDCECFGGDI